MCAKFPFSSLSRYDVIDADVKSGGGQLYTPSASGGHEETSTFTEMMSLSILAILLCTFIVHGGIKMKLGSQPIIRRGGFRIVVLKIRRI